MKNYAVALHLTTLLSSGATKNIINLSIKKGVSAAEALGKAVLEVSPEYNVGAYKVLEIIPEVNNERIDKV